MLAFEGPRLSRDGALDRHSRRRRGRGRARRAGTAAAGVCAGLSTDRRTASFFSGCEIFSTSALHEKNDGGGDLFDPRRGGGL